MKFRFMNTGLVNTKALVQDRKGVCHAMLEDAISLLHAKATSLCLECLHAVDDIPHPNYINKKEGANMVSPKTLSAWVMSNMEMWNKMGGKSG